ncbi:hypothetical protein [Bacillus badius]|uniref:hypothetical protein n=1 Tax=Bacillus badius TaxID=1455 RepID=UPI000597CB40|nr:hypothetical protein [Bacillus badius]KIL71924.1 hypothetical protein SD78_1229 [Bacillus badius]
MKEIEIEVSGQAEEFYLSTTKGWVKVAGHSIAVGGFKFSAVPISGFILVSEVESGAKLFRVPVSEAIESYEETMLFLELNVAVQIVAVIERIGQEKMRNEINRLKAYSLNKFGQKPFTTTIDIENPNQYLH